MTTPKVSVLMPVYNAGTHLPAAVDSILRQTMRDFEFLILDDGSTDETVSYLAGLRDPRIRIERNPQNRGLITTLNKGVELCRAPLVVRMDADDISEPERLEELKKEMDRDPRLAVLGSDFTPIGSTESSSWIRFFESDEVRIALLFENPICHPSVSLRKSFLSQPLYPAEYPHAEDYALWVFSGASVRLGNLRKKLIRYRTHEGQVSRRHASTQMESIQRLILKQLCKLGLKPTEGELYIHQSMSHGFFPSPNAVYLMNRWIGKLERANLATNIYHHDLFIKKLRERHQKAILHTVKKLQSMPLLLRLRWQVISLFRALKK